MYEAHMGCEGVLAGALYLVGEFDVRGGCFGTAFAGDDVGIDVVLMGAGGLRGTVAAASTGFSSQISGVRSDKWSWHWQHDFNGEQTICLNRRQLQP
jgi:hypothetical protein